MVEYLIIDLRFDPLPEIKTAILFFISLPPDFFIKYDFIFLVLNKMAYNVRFKITAKILLNFVNVFFQGTWIFLLSEYSYDWLTTIPFLIGLLVFFLGFYINVRSDEIMINLRKEKGEGYHIPEGFLFNKVSNPNYLGEFIEWLGWAIMTWSWAGLVFFLWTVCNLFPRAISNHNWYQNKFEDYPKERKAVIPNII